MPWLTVSAGKTLCMCCGPHQCNTRPIFLSNSTSRVSVPASHVTWQHANGLQSEISGLQSEMGWRINQRFFIFGYLRRLQPQLPISACDLGMYSVPR